MIRIWLVVVVGVVAVGQDRRTVVEPKMPAKVCATVRAQLSGLIAEADETKLDTERIQKEIDKCPAGAGVVLDVDGGHNAFLAGPLTLRDGVTLHHLAVRLAPKRTARFTHPSNKKCLFQIQRK